MIKNVTKLTSISFALCLLGACSFAESEASKPHPYFGNAVNQNIAAQLVNPDAPDGVIGMPEHNGARSAIAQGRYITDTVEKPEPLTTSDVEIGKE